MYSTDGCIDVPLWPTATSRPTMSDNRMWMVTSGYPREVV